MMLSLSHFPGNHYSQHLQFVKYMQLGYGLMTHWLQSTMQFVKYTQLGYCLTTRWLQSTMQNN